MKLYFSLPIIGILMALDFFSKWLFDSGLYQGLIAECPLSSHPDCLGKYYSLVGESIGFQLSHNPGVAFSIPIHGLPLQILTVLLIFGIFWYYFREEYPKKSMILDTGYIFIIAGALSHAYERIFVGYVVDFIAIKYFAILNFADIFISIGACLVILAYYVRK